MFSFLRKSVFNWWKIGLQFCVGFYWITMQINHNFIYTYIYIYISPTDAELELDFPASMPSWECRDESRFRLSECLFWREMLKGSLKARAKGGCWLVEWEEQNEFEGRRGICLEERQKYMYIYVPLPSWASLPSPHCTPLGHHRAAGWAPWNTVLKLLPVQTPWPAFTRLFLPLPSYCELPVT